MPALEVILKIAYAMGVSATLEQLAASKRGKVFICTLPCLNEVQTNRFGFSEKENKCSLIFSLLPTCLCFIKSVNCFLPLAIVTVSGTKVLCSAMIKFIFSNGELLKCLYCPITTDFSFSPSLW